MSRVVSAGVSYFGKVPSRGDFVRAADNHQLLGWLDRWAGESLELLSQSPDWKQRCERLVSEFAERASAMFDAQARERGGIEAEDAMLGHIFSTFCIGK